MRTPCIYPGVTSCHAGVAGHLSVCAVYAGPQPRARVAVPPFRGVRHPNLVLKPRYPRLPRLHHLATPAAFVRSSAVGDCRPPRAAPLGSGARGWQLPLRKVLRAALNTMVRFGQLLTQRQWLILGPPDYPKAKVANGCAGGPALWWDDAPCPSICTPTTGRPVPSPGAATAALGAPHRSEERPLPPGSAAATAPRAGTSLEAGPDPCRGYPQQGLPRCPRQFAGGWPSTPPRG